MHQSMFAVILDVEEGDGLDFHPRMRETMSKMHSMSAARNVEEGDSLDSHIKMRESMLMDITILVAFILCLGYLTFAVRRRDGRSTLIISLLRQLCYMLVFVPLHAAMVPIMCATLFIFLIHVLLCGAGCMSQTSGQSSSRE